MNILRKERELKFYLKHTWKLDPTSDVLGKDFRWFVAAVETVVEGESRSVDKPLRKRIELLIALKRFAVVSVAIDDELEL